MSFNDENFFSIFFKINELSIDFSDSYKFLILFFEYNFKKLIEYFLLLILSSSNFFINYLLLLKLLLL